MKSFASETKGPLGTRDSRQGSIKASPTALGLARLQDRLGNRGVAELLSSLQTKLEIGRIDSPAEREADRIADTFFSSARPSTAGAGAVSNVSQANTKPSMAKSATGSVSAASNDMRRAFGAGQPLDSGSRAVLEPRLGRDLADVRIHNNAHADASARILGARAFTVGSDIAFRNGTYQPGSTRGRRLLAHELVHVKQNDSSCTGSTRLRRKPDDIPGVGIDRPKLMLMAPGEGRGVSFRIPEHLFFDPCAVKEGALNNADLIANWNRTKRYLDKTKRGEGKWYDYANLMRRLIVERRRRIKMGHTWLAEGGLSGVPSNLYRLQTASGYRLIVTRADSSEQGGMPVTQNQTAVITESQFYDLLRKKKIPRVNPDEFLARYGYGKEQTPLIIHIPPPPPPKVTAVPPYPFDFPPTLYSLAFGFGRRRSLSPFGMRAAGWGYGPGYGQAPGTGYGYGYDPRSALSGMAAVRGGGLRASPFDIAARENLIRRVYNRTGLDLSNPRVRAGAELYWRGGLFEKAALAASYRNVMTYKDLNAVRQNMEVFDVTTRGGVNQLMNVTHELPDPRTGQIRGSHYAGKVRRMIGRYRPGTLNTAITRINRHFGSSLTLADVNTMNFIMVPDDHVGQVRNTMERLISRSPDVYSLWLDGELRRKPLRFGRNTYSSWNEVQAARTSMSRANWQALKQSLGQHMRSRVVGCGIMLAPVLEMQRMRIATQGLTAGEYGAIAAPEYLEARRLQATGLTDVEARARTARASGLRAAGMSASISTAAGVIQLLVADKNNPALMRSVIVNVPVGAAGAFGEAWLESQINMRLSNYFVMRATATGATGSTARYLAGASYLSRFGASTGISAVAAPLVTTLGMGIEELVSDVDYTYIDYTAKGTRALVSGGISGGAGWLAYMGTGAAIGSKAPVLGTIIGAGVGLLVYWLTDKTVGAKVESAVRKGMGEEGCTKKRYAATTVSRPSTRPPPRPFIWCFTADTPVLMADGSEKPIAEVAPGERVWSIPDSDIEAGQLQTCKVGLTISHGPAEYLAIYLDNGSTLKVTANHPVFSGDKWCKAGSLKSGDALMSVIADKKSLSPVKITRIEIQDADLPVYDLVVENCHTFFASGVLVHNKTM